MAADTSTLRGVLNSLNTSQLSFEDAQSYLTGTAGAPNVCALPNNLNYRGTLDTVLEVTGDLDDALTVAHSLGVKVDIPVLSTFNIGGNIIQVMQDPNQKNEVNLLKALLPFVDPALALPIAYINIFQAEYAYFKMHPSDSAHIPE